jgi:hypoxanthine-DNA glycosylase
LFPVCGEEFEDTEEARNALLQKHKIALWDVLESAIGENAADKRIKEERPNDLLKFLNEHPNIKLLVFHSKAALAYYLTYFPNTSIPYIRVTSPSRANTSKTHLEKVADWQAAFSRVLPDLRTEHRLEFNANQLSKE